MPDQIKPQTQSSRTSLFDQIPDLEELRDFEAQPPPPPAVEIRNGRAVVVRRPDRPAEHLCLTCRHYWEYAVQREAGPRGGKQIHVEFAGWCRAGGEPFEMSEQVVLVCNSYGRRWDLREMLREAARRFVPSWAQRMEKSNGHGDGANGVERSG